MKRRGRPGAVSAGDSSDRNESEVKSKTGKMAKVQYNTAVILLFVIIVVLAFFCMQFQSTNTKMQSANTALQGANEKRILKIESIVLELQTSEKRIKELEGEKTGLISKLEFISKKLIDTKHELDKASQNAKETKTELDDKIQHAFSEASKALLNYNNAKAHARDLEDVVKTLREEKHEMQKENEALAFKLGKAIQTSDVVQEELQKLKVECKFPSDARSKQNVQISQTQKHQPDVGMRQKHQQQLEQLNQNHPLEPPLQKKQRQDRNTQLHERPRPRPQQQQQEASRVPQANRLQQPPNGKNEEYEPSSQREQRPHHLPSSRQNLHHIRLPQTKEQQPLRQPPEQHEVKTHIDGQQTKKYTDGGGNAAESVEDSRE